jgi:hypothetical protein
MRVTFTSVNTGQISSGAAAGNYYVTGSGIIYQPWNTSSIIPNPLVAAATLQPYGYTNLVSSGISDGPYESIIVMGSAARITLIGEALADAVTVVVIPSEKGNNFANIGEAMQGRNAESALSSSAKPLTITNAISTANFFGAPSLAVANSDFYPLSNATEFLWGFWWATNSASNLASPLAYKIEMSWDCILSQLSVEGLLDTVSTSQRKKRDAAKLQTDDNDSKESSSASSASSSSVVKALTRKKKFNG